MYCMCLVVSISQKHKDQFLKHFLDQQALSQETMNFGIIGVSVRASLYYCLQTIQIGKCPPAGTAQERHSKTTEFLIVLL